MVLRILLEYYRNEKKMKAFIFRKLFKEQAVDRIALSFSQFYEIILQVQPDVLDFDVARLYR